MRTAAVIDRLFTRKISKLKTKIATLTIKKKTQAMKFPPLILNTVKEDWYTMSKQSEEEEAQKKKEASHDRAHLRRTRRRRNSRSPGDQPLPTNIGSPSRKVCPRLRLTPADSSINFPPLPSAQFSSAQLRRLAQPCKRLSPSGVRYKMV